MKNGARKATFAISDLARLEQVRCQVCRGRGHQQYRSDDSRRNTPEACSQCGGRGVVWRTAVGVSVG